MTTIRELLARGRDTLVAAEVDTPMLDATVLLAHAMGATKEQLIAALPEEADKELARRYGELIGQRSAGRPVSYIRRMKEFWGLEFHVDEAVLVPRPDTETLVDAALHAGPGARLLDLCTGSGCAAIAIASERPELVVDAVDVSPAAVAVARRNAARHGLESRVTVHGGDLYAPLPEGARYSMIVSNPPYVPDAEIDGLAAEVRREPRLALAGGADGLDVVRRILAGAPRFLAPGGAVLLEIDPRQAAAVSQKIGSEALGVCGEVVRDLAGQERVVVFRT